MRSVCWRSSVAGLFAVALLAAPGWAKPARSATVVIEFKRLQPCPATGKVRGACPGWVVDHIEPLCAGGPDKVSNMQWQTVQDAKTKDKLEVRQCSAMRRLQAKNKE